MLTLPEIIERPQRACIFVPFTVTVNQMQKPAAEGFPRLFEYIERHGLKAIEPAFYNYRRIDMANTLDVEAGICIEDPGPGGEGITTGTLPAGRFVTMTWHGHPDRLMDVTTLLVGWSRLTATEFDVTTAPDGDHFACRLELYDSDPVEEPDMNNWQTRLEFKLRD